jgi:hypothetical protein
MDININIPFIGSISGSPGEWRKFVKWILSRLPLIALGAGLASFWFYEYGPMSHNSVPITLSGSRVANFKFIDPGNSVPSCYTYFGTGKIPVNDTVLAFDRIVNDIHHPLTNSVYSPDWGIATDAGWKVPTEIGVGNPPGTQIELVALLVPKSMQGFFDNLVLEGEVKYGIEGEWWKTHSLPPSIQITSPLYVTFNGQRGECKKEPARKG